MNFQQETVQEALTKVSSNRLIDVTDSRVEAYFLAGVVILVTLLLLGLLILSAFVLPLFTLSIVVGAGVIGILAKVSVDRRWW